MPLDYSSEFTPSFRELTEAGLRLLTGAPTRGDSRSRRLHRTPVIIPVPAVPRPVSIYRRSPLPGSLS